MPVVQGLAHGEAHGVVLCATTGAGTKVRTATFTVFSTWTHFFTSRVPVFSTLLQVVTLTYFSVSTQWQTLRVPVFSTGTHRVTLTSFSTHSVTQVVTGFFSFFSTRW